jgi:hypothetical protein
MGGGVFVLIISILFLLVVGLKHTKSHIVNSFLVFCRLHSILFPRGRFDIELFGSFLEMHAKEKDYKVNYSSIVKLFQLPRPDKGTQWDACCVNGVNCLVRINSVSVLCFLIFSPFSFPFHPEPCHSLARESAVHSDIGAADPRWSAQHPPHRDAD